MLGLIGEKIGMTQVFDDKGNAVAVTVIKAGPCGVVNIRSADQNGYLAVQLGFEVKKAKSFNKPNRVYLEKKKASLYSKLKEFRVDNIENFEVGQKLTVSSFKPGDMVKVTGKTKGRGFQGVMKRWNKHGQPATHGAGVHRAPGSIGMNSWPSHVIKGMKLPGHYGDEIVTTKNLKIVDIKTDDNLLLIEGSIPGSKNGFVYIYNQDPNYEARPELKSIEEKTEELAEKVEERTEEKTEEATEKVEKQTAEVGQEEVTEKVKKEEKEKKGVRREVTTL